MTKHPSHAPIARRTFVRAAIRRDGYVCWTLKLTVRMQSVVIAP
jgi:hypothetical protein